MSQIVQVELTDEIKHVIDSMTEEFIEHKGYITCEFSLQEKYLVAAHQYIHAKNRDLPGYGMWRIYMCETCISHNAHQPYHVDIMVVEKRPEDNQGEIA